MSFSSFCWGLLVGFLLEWLCDWIFWRKARPADQRVINDGVLDQRGVDQRVMGSAGAATTSLPPGIASYRQDDLEAIEGIVPKIAELLRNAGIITFAQLSATSKDKLLNLLEAGGPRFKLANPSTWAEQAALAANNDWVGFDKIRKELVAGIRSSDV